MNRLSPYIVHLCAGLAAAVILGMVLALILVNRPVGGDAVVTVTIEPGMTADEIAEHLEREGVIRSAGLFRLITRVTGSAREFRAGDHPLALSLSTRAMVDALTHNPPPPPPVRVTIPEGRNIRETAAIVSRTTGVDSTAVDRLANDADYAAKLGIDKPSLEGYLYPDTYFFHADVSADTVVRRLVDRFHEVFDDSLKARADSLGMTVHEIVTLASLIEMEVSKPGERPIVSSVFHRRLELNRPLEANPTIQYAIGEKRRILTEDLDVDSPYNTYTHAGLPPGPIASPGRASLLAALYPADTRYLYFVADGSGGHVFSRSLREHINAVNKYRRIRRSQRAADR